MDEKNFVTLEYTKILEKLSNYTYTYLGKEMCLNLKPSSNKDFVKLELSKTTEAVSLLTRVGKPPISEISNIFLPIKKLDSSMPLLAKELLDIASILKMARNLKNYFYFSDDEEIQSNFPNLFDYFSSLYTNSNIENKIFASILDEDTISDDASSTLKEIRRNIRKAENEIKEKLNNMIHSSSYSKYLQEPVITIRNDRFVIPVKEEYRSFVKGFIHDMSASGSTVFIEPIAIFDLNNKISNLKIEETIEIQKILEKLSSFIVPITNEIKSNVKTIANLDFYFAKAYYSENLNAIEPIISSEKEIILNKARHPLLNPNTVVPIDISLGKDYSCLVITGPNTGGKTVSLKTVGLLCLMACSGLHIPAKEGSKLYVFDHIFADIGDEQSIEASLSTFSSHMVNISNIVNKATPNSLVLLDELGSGTDPQEGSSLAISILDYLFKKDMLILATTHYPEMKNYALVTNGFKNASCEFDVENLKPTYKLLIGIPGKSNAFAISKKLGLLDEILQNAKNYLNPNSISIEELLKEIYDNKIKIEKDKEEIEKNKNQIVLLRKSLERDNTILKEKESSIIENAKEQARDILFKAKNEATQIIRDLNTIESEPDSIKKANQLRNKINEDLKKIQPSIKKDNVKTTSLKKEQITVGMSVFVSTWNQIGTVTSLPNKENEVTVQIGSIKMNVPISNISKSEKSTKQEIHVEKNYKSSSSSLKSKNVTTEINVIGLNVEEATLVVDKFLDDAIISHLSTVRIVHGKGTGTLRNGIQQFLKKHPHVESYRIGNYGEGEMGVTIVTLKK